MFFFSSADGDAHMIAPAAAAVDCRDGADEDDQREMMLMMVTAVAMRLLI